MFRFALLALSGLTPRSARRAAKRVDAKFDKAFRAEDQFNADIEHAIEQRHMVVSGLAGEIRTLRQIADRQL